MSNLAFSSFTLNGVDAQKFLQGQVTLNVAALAENAKAELRQKLAVELDQISSGRVTIRAPRGGKINATFVASRPGTAKPDVFLKL